MDGSMSIFARQKGRQRGNNFKPIVFDKRRKQKRNRKSFEEMAKEYIAKVNG